MAWVALQGIVKNYDGSSALRGVDLRVDKGSLYGLIGADGAGKSTLLQIVTTILRPDSGGGSVLGLDLVKDMAQIRRRVGMMTQKFSLYVDLTVLENLEFFAALYGLGKMERRKAMAQLLRFTRLETAATRRAGRLSGGMKQKLALACALVHTPELLVLDEPSVGVDPVTRRDFWELLGHLRQEQGMTVLVSTPYMDEAARCDSLTFLHRGAVLAAGTPQALCRSVALALFRIATEQPLHWPVDKVVPAGLRYLYTAGGELRAATQLGGTSNLVREALAAQGLDMAGMLVEPCAVGIEDYLLMRLLEVS
jgi:ABC-2 type transport system ATP-binding protein